MLVSKPRTRATRFLSPACDVATVEIARPALEQLGALIVSHLLPANTRERFRRVLEPLEEFPKMGRSLEDIRPGLRALIGVWRWMLVLYVRDTEPDRVVVVGIEDGRSSSAVTNR